jgi:hypothetical protein
VYVADLDSYLKCILEHLYYSLKQKTKAIYTKNIIKKKDMIQSCP